MKLKVRNGNLINPFSLRSILTFKGGYIVEPFDDDTITGMTAAGIPNDNTLLFVSTPYEISGTQLWTEVNKLIRNLKGTGVRNFTHDFWTDSVQYLMDVGNSSSSCAVNFRSPGVKDATFFGAGWSFNGNGAKPNGATGTYCSTNIAPTELGAEFFMCRYNTTSGQGETKTQMGASNSAGSQGYMIHHAGNTCIYTASTITSSVTAVDHFSAGLQSWNRSGGKTRGSRRGLRVTDVTQSALAGVNVAITLNCLNRVGGTQVNFSNVGTGFSAIINRSLTEEEEVVFNDIVEDFQVQLNRDMDAKIAIGFGDSIMLGNGLSGGQANRWFSQVCLSKGWTEINRGVDGTTLINAVVVNRIASPNMYQNMTAIPVYDPDKYSALVFEYLVNDTGLFYAAYTAETVSQQAGEISDFATSTRGWPPEKIVWAVGFYCDESLGCWDFYPSHGTAQNPITLATNERHEELIEAVRLVAVDKNNTFASPYTTMEAAGITYLGNPEDGRHPNAAGHLIAANDILTKITHL